LIPTAELDTRDTAEGAVLRELPLASIVPNPHQPRRFFDEESLQELAASIREVGVLQPILVRPTAGDQFELVAGERRWRAAKRAGLAMVPAIIRSIDDALSVEQALIENLHRADLNPLEEASAYQALIEEYGLTHEQVAQRVGKSRSAISNTLRLLTLPPALHPYLIDGRLSAGHARALLGTPDRAFQEALARRAVSEGLSVRQVEEAVRARSAERPSGIPSTPSPAGPTSIAGSPAGRTPLRPPGLLELEELLSNHLDTRVKVSMTGGRGKVIIEFATLEDLERIYRAMTEPEPLEE
jgi:ParB family chromosome partitioning protein